MHCLKLLPRGEILDILKRRLVDSIYERCNAKVRYDGQGTRRACAQAVPVANVTCSCFPEGEDMPALQYVVHAGTTRHTSGVA
jgi:hypothetical protein